MHVLLLSPGHPAETPARARRARAGDVEVRSLSDERRGVEPGARPAAGHNRMQP